MKTDKKIIEGEKISIKTLLKFLYKWVWKNIQKGSNNKKKVQIKEINQILRIQGEAKFQVTESNWIELFVNI